MTWATIITPPSPPEWHGESRIHTLPDETPEDDPARTQRKAAKWKPWGVLGRETDLEAAYRGARGVWDVLA